MEAEPLEVAAWRMAAGDLQSEDLPALATDALVRGIDSPALRELAAQDPSDVRDSRDLFQHALTEIGIIVPDREDAIWKLVRMMAGSIVSGDVSPESGANWIWRHASNDVEDSGDLRIFVGLASELEDHPEDLAWREKEIVEAAAELLARSSPRRWIKLMAIQGRSPLSRTAFSDSVAIEPESLPISTELLLDLQQWDAEHAAALSGWPDSGGFASEQHAESFVNRGKQLASRLQTELGPGYQVEYMPEPIRPPGVKLRNQ